MCTNAQVRCTALAEKHGISYEHAEQLYFLKENNMHKQYKSLLSSVKGKSKLGASK